MNVCKLTQFGFHIYFVSGLPTRFTSTFASLFSVTAQLVLKRIRRLVTRDSITSITTNKLGGGIKKSNNNVEIA
jgi:hypothetical protein